MKNPTTPPPPPQFLCTLSYPRMGTEQEVEQFLRALDRGEDPPKGPEPEKGFLFSAVPGVQ